MSDIREFHPRLKLRSVVIGLVLFLAILGAAVVFRSLVPESLPVNAKRSAAGNQPRPIVEIVRPQSGLPDLSQLVSRLCPSVAVIVPRGEAAPIDGADATAPVASVYSSDGWLVTTSDALPDGPIDALFGDGSRISVSARRTDPVSGLTVLKTDTNADAISFSDQTFPQVGQFGLLLDTPRGAGCSAGVTMIGSDFIADGAASGAFARIQPPPGVWAGGTPLVGNDGRLIGIAVSDNGTIMPASIAAVVIDELVRNSMAPSVQFGFRAVDFAPPVSERLGDVRSGATVALVAAKSSGARSGLQAGDVVLSVGDSPVSSASELNRLLDASKGRVTLSVQRGSVTSAIAVRRTAS